MAVIKVVTDSGADIPHSLAAQLGIQVVPLTINFDSEQLCDGVDIQPQTFYERLARGDHPSTTQPSPADFEAVYREVAREADVIISCHLSGALSGTLQSATLAAREVEVPVHVLDTRSASLGIGVVAIEAARMAEAGLPIDQILSRLQSIIDTQQVLFLVDTLEYLQRNGRIGRAQAFVGGLLNIKPLLMLEDGVVSPLERARGRRAATARLLERMAQGDASRPLRLGLMHANVPEEAEALQDEIRARFKVDELTVTELGPTIGTHAGPGALGIVFYPVA